MNKEELHKFWNALLGFTEGDRVKYRVEGRKTWFYGDVIEAIPNFVWLRVQGVVIWVNPKSLIKVQRRNRK